VELPQVYRRLDEHSYAYLARSVSYEATLILASNGFRTALSGSMGRWRLTAKNAEIVRPWMRSGGFRSAGR